MECRGLEKLLFTSESVACGHPDKIADRISDAVLDGVLKQDPEGRVACETFIPNGNEIFIGGEITTTAKIDVDAIARKLIEETGYTHETHGLDFKTVKIHNLIKKQSPDIALGVNAKKDKEQGAGDQGHMFGFAIHETDEFMPLALTLSHRLAQKLEEVRKDGTLPYLRPDGKTQVTLEYNEKGEPWRVHSVVVAAQHDEGISHEQIEEDIQTCVINAIPSLAGKIYSGTSYYINATGKFVIGGPAGDAGLTGRKIIVDTYGGGSLMYRAGHGGGAFSGKDPSKVDRSGAYAARYIAKNIVASGLAYACEVQLAYCIGIAEPISITINTFGIGKILESELVKKVREHFPLKPADIINHFGLKNPIYSETACYGHFGNPQFPWEKIDKIDVLLFQEH